MVFFLLFGTAGCILSVYYILKITSYHKAWATMPAATSSSNQFENVSVIIPVKNEEKDIEKCVQSILQQDFPGEIEILVVNDHSTDSTLEILSALNNPAIRFLNLEDHLESDKSERPNKKQALRLGIKNARHDLMLTTDGDCWSGKDWVKIMVNEFLTKSYSYETGAVLYKEEKGILNTIQLIDNISLVGVTAAAIFQGNPKMSYGANSMFRRKDFESLGGFRGHSQVASGDDVLLMMRFHAKKLPIGFVKSKQAIVYTNAVTTIKEFLNQRLRWLSKSKYMQNEKATYELVIVYFFNLIILISLIFSSNYYFLSIFVSTFLLKLFLDLHFIRDLNEIGKVRNLHFWIFPTELLYLFYVCILGVLSQVIGFKWKGNKVKN